MKINLDLIYPVGSIYMNISDTIDPNIVFGGTWELIKNRFLIGAGGEYSIGDYGGEKTHTLTAQELPTHKHNFTGSFARYETGSGDNYNGDSQRFLVARNHFVNAQSGTSTSNSLVPASYLESWTLAGISGGGEGQAHNNIPPYLAVYIWKRIA